MDNSPNYYGSPPAPAAPTPTISAAEPEHKPLISGFSLAFLVLLLLAFFTPLGATMFLPLLIVGTIAAAKYVHRSESESALAGQPKNPLITALKIIVIVALVIALCIMGLIALVFIAFASGAVKMDFGS